MVLKLKEYKETENKGIQYATTKLNYFAHKISLDLLEDKTNDFLHDISCAFYNVCYLVKHCFKNEPDKITESLSAIESDINATYDLLKDKDIKTAAKMIAIEVGTSSEQETLYNAIMKAIILFAFARLKNVEFDFSQN